ncbi:MAG: hypothetical protein HY303_13920, partial [Candidatus Wallbacteria bacterium]|nr:hypothetical protein [Candidatus Wallbacteria bacterium]
MKPSRLDVRPPARLGLRARHGFNLVGLLLLLFVLGGSMLFVSRLARQAGVTGYWYHDAQQAQNLADSALKATLLALREASSAQLAQAAPWNAAALVAVHDALTGASGAAGPITLMSDSSAATLAPAIANQLEDLADFSPSVEVTLKVLDAQPLWTGLLEGVPADAAEKRGAVQVVSKASVKRRSAMRVTRSILVEKEYKVVNVLPAVLGRFALFVQTGEGQDPNFVSVQFDSETGDGTPGAGGAALEIQSRVSAPYVAAGTRRLDRSSLSAASAGPKFLDSQGWVYLGGGDSASTWKLRLAHGYGDGGESPLLPGDRARIAFGGSPAVDSAFLGRFKAALDALGLCQIEFVEPADGLYHFHHGFAANYELIGLEPTMFPTVQSAPGARLKPDLGPGDASCLRLFGSAPSLSPTIVFGPVQRVYARRAVLQGTLQPGTTCATPGRLAFTLFRLPEHAAGVRGLLTSAFGTDQAYDAWGTAVVEEPYAQSLNVVLDAQGAGEYGPMGVLDRVPETPGTARYSSALLPWLGQLPAPDGLPQEALQKLWNGEAAVPRLFEGNLSRGIPAFLTALRERMAFRLRPEAARNLLFAGPTLKVPGIALVEQTEPFSIGPVDRVASGGILVTRGPLSIHGNIRRGAGNEPL